MTFVWTKERPTCPGRYWIRSDRNFHAHVTYADGVEIRTPVVGIVRVDWCMIDDRAVHKYLAVVGGESVRSLDAEWAGPIPEPVEEVKS